MKINDFLHYTEVPAGCSGERTVYGDKHREAEYYYSDRLMEWDYQHYNNCVDKVKAEKHTSEWYEEFLSLYFKKKVKLAHMKIGVDVGTGHQYNLYGITQKGEQEEKK